MRHVVVMVTTSYPRFPGDGVGSFIEPIAKGVAAQGHEVHLVAPWHPRLERSAPEDGVHFHFYRYAPSRSLNVFGYAEGLRADTDLRLAAWVAAPAALVAGWFKALRVAQKRRATVVHAHWVIPNGLVGRFAAGPRPLVISLHGSDVYVAEQSALAARAARMAFARASWVTACSRDLATRAVAVGADPARTEVVPYGVDSTRFRPDTEARTRIRRELRLDARPMVFSAGRLVRKKGFEFLIDAMHQLPGSADAVLLVAGDGDLRAELTARAAGLGDRVRLLGNRSQDDIAALSAAADLIAVPSVHDEAGNVDGLPNFALEALASGTAVVATRVGGLPDAIADGVSGCLVEERNSAELAGALARLLADPERRAQLGQAGRERVIDRFGWDRVAARLVAAYDRARS